MKKRTKIILSSAGAVLVLGLAGGGYYIYKTVVPQKIAVDKNATVQSNYYQYINKKWLEKTKIPSDQPAQNAFGEISNKIKKKMKKDVKQMVAHKDQLTSNDQKEFTDLYQMATNFKKREKDGIKPVKPYLDKIEGLSSYDDFTKNIPDFVLANIPLPFAISVSSNPENSNQRMLYLSSPSTILPDVTYYKNEASKKQLLSVYESSATKVLKLMGYKGKESQKIVKEAIKFDSLMVPYIPSSEELSEVKNSIHVTESKDIHAYDNGVALDQVMNQLVNQDVAQANITTPKYFKNLSKVVNAKNFRLMKSWMLVQEAMSDAPALTEKLRQASAEYSLYISGTKKAPSKVDSAFSSTTGVFTETLSVYYGQKHFGQAAKSDVTNMIDHIIDVYRSRLRQNNWLSDQTKAEAINKLEKMHYYIGYPDKVSDLTKSFDVDEQKTYFENLANVTRVQVKYNFDNYNKPVDKSIWSMASYDVNAYYTPVENAIYFPAGILQAPFYSQKQSVASNYGGIGTVIGHEITHAFDNNGAQFDEAGDMKDWWTKADYKAFEQKTKAMQNLFDGIKIYGKTVNGKQTVSENIADAGGLSASYQALQSADKDAKAKEYFENWARIWRQKSSLQYAQYAMSLDVHAPNELRANVQLKNFDPFYEAYSIKKGDDMYLPKKDRVSIW
ncbi:M13-type metalloendopeptidase [Streptococcus caballi]|uniref:M13-type metalloendopeptidase n=1 Tax=Streptococcus caballi TaxID=439220 RepID=UPI00036A230F|nr:M13 family metallopeptidase [Streptococcus caballi]